MKCEECKVNDVVVYVMLSGLCGECDDMIFRQKTLKEFQIHIEEESK